MRNGFKRFGAYVVKEQDPIFDVLLSAKKFHKAKDTEIAGEGVSAGTLGRWWRGRTRSPKFSTAAAAAAALGMDSLPITPAARKRARDGWK